MRNPDLFSEDSAQESHVSDDKGQTTAEMLKARRVALDILDQVLARRIPLDQVLERDEGFKALDVRDRAFCRMLVSTCLRRLGQVDDLIFRAEDRPKSKSPVIQNILRIGVTQLMFMQVPDHAAVDTSVRLTERLDMGRQKAFVNAILREITRRGEEWLGKQDEARLNTPAWLLKTWIADYGLRTAAEIATAHLSEAPLDITLRNEDERKHWVKALKTTDIAAGSLRRLSGGAVVDLPGFVEGKWWVQDASAAVPVTLLGDVKDKTVVDFCAAPGGKTMQLAARGAHVIAIDRSAPRLKRLAENLERLKMNKNVEVVISDALQWRPKEAPTHILLDAPCSATGTIRRHPDVPYLKTSGDVDRLVSVQSHLLSHAFDLLAPGGLLIYCVCSLQKSEGERQIEDFISSRSDAHKVAVSAEEIGGIEEAVTDDGDVRFLPHHQSLRGGMDGFFISRIKKIS